MYACSSVCLKSPSEVNCPKMKRGGTSLQLAIVVLFASVGLIFTKGPGCYDCSKQPNPYSCNQVKTCEADQKCFSTSYFDSNNAEIYWDTSCKTKAFCGALDSRIQGIVNSFETEVILSALDQKLNQSGAPSYEDGKFSGDSSIFRRNSDPLFLCAKCCDGDYCNLLLCEQDPANRPSRPGLSCFSCTGVADPANCSTIDYCQAGQLCAVWTMADGTVSMGCKDKQVCDAEGDQVLYGKRDGVKVSAYDELSVQDQDYPDSNAHWLSRRDVLPSGCHACCDSNFCAAKYCSKYLALPAGVSTVTLPTTTTPTSTTTTTTATTTTTTTTTTTATTTTTTPIPLAVSVTPTIADVTEGNDVVFQCSVTGQPPLDVYFTKTDGNKNYINISSCSTHITSPKQDVRCNIYNVQTSNQGPVTCHAVNSFQHLSSSAVLTVQEIIVPLTVVKQPSDTLIVPRHTTNIECRVDGKPLPQYRWLKVEAGVESEIANNSNFVTGYDANKNTAVLTVKSLAPNDVDGKYICRAENAYSSETLSFALRTITQLTLISPPNNVSVVAKDVLNVSFSCTFRSYPPAHVRWFYITTSNQSVPASPLSYNSTVNGDNVKSDLVIIPDPVKHANISAYKCEADNGYYTSSGTGYIELLGPPKITTPTQPQSYSIARGADLTLTCRADGSPPPSITWQYINEFGVPYILSDVTVEASGTKLVIGKLDQSGTFTCYAANYLGVDSVEFAVTVT